jgi:hypothetical protein
MRLSENDGYASSTPVGAGRKELSSGFLGCSELHLEAANDTTMATAAVASTPATVDVRESLGRRSLSIYLLTHLYNSSVSLVNRYYAENTLKHQYQNRENESIQVMA